jgi:hypothetical protein
VAAKRVDAKLVAGYGRILPGNYRFPTFSVQPKVAANNSVETFGFFDIRLFTSGFALPALHFQLFPQSVLRFA